MFKLDEAAEGKSVHNPETMLRPAVVYECRLACSNVLGASRKLKVRVNARIYSKFIFLFFLITLLYP